MRHQLGIVFALTALTLIAGCGGGGGSGITDIPQLVQDMADCTGLALVDFGTVIDRLQSIVLDFGSLPPGITLTPGPGPNQFDFTATLDFNGDTLTDGDVQGRVDFSADPSGGIAGVTSHLLWTVTSTVGVTGNGSVQIIGVDADTATMTGAGSLSSTGCTFAVTAMNLTLEAASATGIPTGTIDFVTTIGSDSLDGTLTLDGTTIGQITTDSPIGTIEFSVDLETGVITF